MRPVSIVHVKRKSPSCSGTSARSFCFGGDRSEACEALARLVKAAACIRGIARALPGRCVVKAEGPAFTRLTPTATLPRLPFHQATGFCAEQAITHEAGDDCAAFVHMTKRLDSASTKGRARID